MQFIDIHTHIYPDEIALKATNSVREFYQIGLDGEMDGTVDMLLRRGKQAGISKFVVLPVAIRPDRVQGINDYLYSECKKHDNFIGFGTVHAKMEGLTDEVQRIMDLGLHGIKMHPDSQRFSIDDPRLFPMYEQIQGKIPVMLHMGDHRYDYSHPIKLRKVLDNFPRLQAIAAHFGGYSMYDIAYDLLKDKDCIMDVSSSLMFMEKGIAEKYINAYGAERMAFGSDYPLWDPVKELNRFMGLNLTMEQKEQMAWKTAHRFLKLK